MVGCCNGLDPQALCLCCTPETVVEIKRDSSFTLPLLMFAVFLASDVDDALPFNALCIKCLVSLRIGNQV